METDSHPLHLKLRDLDKARWALALLFELLFKNLLLFITLSFMFSKFLEVGMSLSWGKSYT